VRLIAIVLLTVSCAPPLQQPAPGAIVALSSGPRPAQTFLNNGKCIAVDEQGVVHVVWIEVLGTPSEGIETQGQIFYTRSSDGVAFSAPAAISQPIPMSGAPKIAASGGSLLVVWHQEDQNRLRIFFDRSDDHGFSWAAPVAIGDGAFPAIDADGAQVAVAWQNPMRPPSDISEIFLATSSDRGQSFSPQVMASSDDGISSWTVSVAVSGSAVHLAWTDERHDADAGGVVHDCGAPGGSAADCHEEEYYRRSDDLGATFGAEQRLTIDPPGAPRPSWCPSLVANGGEVHLVWFDQRAGSWQAYHRGSLDGGDTWSDALSITAQLGAPDGNWIRPSLAMRSGALALTFWRQTQSEENAWATASADGGATWSAAQQLSSASPARHPSVALAPDGTPRFAWYQPADGTDQMFYRALP